MKVQVNLWSFLAIAACLGLLPGCSSMPNHISTTGEAITGGDIIINSTTAQHDDPFNAGRTAALALKEDMGNTPIHAVVISENFEDHVNKNRVLKGVCSVFPRKKVFGFSTYGSFSQSGCYDTDSVGLLGIGGDGISVAVKLRKKLGIAGLTMEDNLPQLKNCLQSAGSDLAAGLGNKNNKLLILMADAHSPKNQFLVEGAQKVMGKNFPITGGSANKNADQTFIYYQGKIFTDSAIAIMLSGDFNVSLSGRQAKENAKVISSAGDGAKEAIANSTGDPIAVLAYNCAGRKGKLDNIADELAAIKSEIGNTTPLFGCYCAGEIGPADIAEKNENILSSGVGWHVMFTVLAR